MQSTGWDKKVEEYEAGLEKVLPRTEQILGRIDFHKPDNEEAKLKLLEAQKAEMEANKTFPKAVQWAGVLVPAIISVLKISGLSIVSR